MHEGHRKRIRERYLLNGLEGFADHEVLELLLFYADRRGDTNPTAHRLIDRFGSLASVFEADCEELIQVEGVGEAAATLISLVPRLFRRYEENKTARLREINSVDDAKKYIAPKFFGLNEEHVLVVCMDNQNGIKNSSFLSEGTTNDASVDVRKIIKTALNNNAVSIIIAHNHPDGVAAPSKADVDATILLIDTLKAVGVRLVDHIIISDTDLFSMKGSERLSVLFA